MLGIGGAAKYSAFRGRGLPAEANRALSHTLRLGGVFALACLAAGLFFAVPIARAMGAAGDTFEMCRTYLRVILLFAPAFLLNNIMLAFARNEGAPHLAIWAMLGGSLSNVALDYVFIFPLDMGIFGAVFATGLAPCISLSILFPFLLGKRRCFRAKDAGISARLIGGICSAGFPSLVTELSSGIVMFVFNGILLGLHGTAGVAAYGIVANLSLVVLSMYTGIAQGIQPLVSRYYGRKEEGNIHRALRYALGTVAVLSAAAYAGIFLGAESVASLFNSGRDPGLQALAVPGLRIYFTGCLFAGANIVLASCLAATGQAKPAGLISLARGFFVILPLALILPKAWGATGLWSAFPVTELLVCLLGAALYRRSGGVLSGEI